MKSGVLPEMAIIQGIINSSSEVNRLSAELHQRITQEMNDLLSNVSSEFQRGISEAINEQVLQ